jgi:hypothetical protein
MENDLYNLIKLTEPELIWLQEVYKYFLEDNNVGRRIIKIKLLDKLPITFNPLTINSILLRNGNEITLAGILYIDPNSPFLAMCDKYICYIKNKILKSPSTNEIYGKIIFDELSISGEDLLKILEKLNEFGSFSSGYAASRKEVFNVIIGSDEVYDELLAYKNIKSLIFNKVKSKLEHSTPIITSYPNSNEEKYNPLFRSSIKQVDKNLCFVLMPFSEVWSNRVFKLIRPIVESLNLQCLRADNLSGPIIIEDIWVKINQCGLIIADVTNKNPNVMYELGIVHTIGKPAVLITQDIDQIPFDFTHLRHNEYADNADGFEKLAEELPKKIREIYSEIYNMKI